MNEPVEFTVSAGDMWQAKEKLAAGEPRRFYLDRSTDVTGASGTGRVADGVLWPDGTVTIRWRGEHQSTVNWDNLASAELVHGHDGATRMVFLDLGEDERVAELERLRAELAWLRAGEDLTTEPAEGECRTPGQWLAAWNQMPVEQRLEGIGVLFDSAHTGRMCQEGCHATLQEELVAMARRAGAAEAAVLHAAEVLKHTPQSCRYHGTEFEKSGMRRGLPKCESCQQPYRVTKVLAAIEGTD
jgi:hypothetical protein